MKIICSLLIFLILSSCTTTPGVSQIPFSQEWKKHLRVNVATDNAVKCYLLHDVKIPYSYYIKEEHASKALQGYNLGRVNHSHKKYMNIESITQLQMGSKKIAMKAAEDNFISIESCNAFRKQAFADHKHQRRIQKEAEARAKRIHENRFQIRCLEIGFKDETIEMANCILKQEEIEAIRESKEPTVINDSSKRSSYTFCQQMPGAYTTTYHCW